ncbi:leucine--tRNA ligase [Candidatus Vallotia tarda]|uniref:Leucine--tRNA ligase n=1 Tax=Candidatus Vallotiella hemipterorum TaxID=1177213 RepID=A0A916JSI3_9BURK|nr:leucine--tRNA ligase [Candidatus Vallotia tarda]CAG7599813.1 Leucine--tRNA ligase [Candidatus Vallotia tarda]
MQDKYVPANVESAVQKAWRDNDVYRSFERTDKKKFYCVSMLPYPSGKLHMGHVRNYTINDVMYRYQRMRGYNVLMPMGWDAFGMPAENAAISNGVPPAKWTYENIACMKKQMQAIGLAIDWSREITTCKPEYYKWNQWLFLKMLAKGIAYKREGIVNWDPVEQTVLANEQVIDGRGWRSGAIVQKREIPMYYLRITEYAELLLQDLDALGWPERVKMMQHNWIGKSYGINFSFPYEIDGRQQFLRVFTTRANTIIDITFVAISIEHPLATRLAKKQCALQAFIDECKNARAAKYDMSAMERKGVSTGFYVAHPLTGADIEVWISNYVLINHGEGTAIGVPMHDERDFEFATKYRLPIKRIDAPRDKGMYSSKDCCSERCIGVCAHSDRYDGIDDNQVAEAIEADLAVKGLGRKQVTYRLHDWGISRQRYWGTPIPMIYCSICGDVPVPEQDLPVLLPEDLVPNGSGNPLAKSEAFMYCICPRCGAEAKRETDTMDTFVDSAWYFSRYTCSNASTIVDARTDYWMPMDQYIGGIEHAILHLLYSRFWAKVMQDLGLTNFSEPATNLVTQGMVLDQTYYREDSTGKKTWFNSSNITLSYNDKGRPISASLHSDGQAVQIGGLEKMSKSKNNGVDPQHLINLHGADTVRLFTIFAASPEQSLEWSSAGLEGARRFLRRLWTFGYMNQAMFSTCPVLDTAILEDESKILRREIHSMLKQADFDYQRLQYNTIVSAAMKMLNALELAKAVSAAVLYEGYGILLRILYPVAPHITFTLWRELGYTTQFGTLLDAVWPKVNQQALEQSEVALVLQINGKARSTLQVAHNAPRESIEKAALEHEILTKFSKGKIPKKVVIVPGRLVNVVF